MSMFQVSHEEVKKLREKYQYGIRVELVNMGPDPHPINPGEQGTVSRVDDGGTIHIVWDNGRILGVVPTEDIIKII